MKNLSENVIKAAIKAAIMELDLPRGEEQVLDINIQGTAIVRQGQDYIQAIDHTIPYAELLQVALSKLNGVTVSALMREVLEGIENGGVDTSEVKENAKQALRELKGLAQRNCSGKITFQKNGITGTAEAEFCMVC